MLLHFTSKDAMTPSTATLMLLRSILKGTLESYVVNPTSAFAIVNLKSLIVNLKSAFETFSRVPPSLRAQAFDRIAQRGADGVHADSGKCDE